MFYDLFKKLCDTRGVSVSKACMEMGLSRSIAAKWKNTKTNPSAEVLPKIAKYFGVSIDFLLGAAETETPIPVSEDGLDAEKRAFIEKLKNMDSETVAALNQLADTILAKRAQ